MPKILHQIKSEKQVVKRYANARAFPKEEVKYFTGCALRTSNLQPAGYIWPTTQGHKAWVKPSLGGKTSIKFASHQKTPGFWADRSAFPYLLVCNKLDGRLYLPSQALESRFWKLRNMMISLLTFQILSWIKLPTSAIHTYQGVSPTEINVTYFWVGINRTVLYISL